MSSEGLFIVISELFKCVVDGFYNVSTSLTIGCEFDMSSEGLPEKAAEEGWYKADDGTFNFAAVFSEPQKDSGNTTDRRDKGRQLLEKLTATSK
jgi:dipeptidase